MIGERYWSVGIMIQKGYRGWSVWCDFLDNGFCDDDATEGVLRARYLGSLDQTVDLVKRDAEKLGIEWQNPTVYYKGDGEDKDSPENACQIADKQAERLGWRACYGSR